MWESFGSIINAMWDSIGPVSGDIGFLAFSLIGILFILIGTVSVFFGRKLHGIFGAVFGMFLGISVTTSPILNLATLEPAWAQIVVFATVGAIGTIAGVAVWKLMPVLVGAGAFSVMGLMVAQSFGITDATLLIVIFVAAFIGVLLSLAVFDWAIILGTSVVGAMLVCMSAAVVLKLSNPIAWIVFAVYASAGIWQQSRELQRQREAALAELALYEQVPVPNTNNTLRGK